jgi:hypothetical protein
MGREFSEGRGGGRGGRDRGRCGCGHPDMKASMQ